jgi:DNA-binding CsgD family transcriptional regulator
VKSSLNASRITLRQLCNMGLPAAVILPSVLGAIREMLAARHTAFFYCDEAGNMVNMYAEKMLSPDAMASYFEKHYRAEFDSFSCAYLQRVAAPDPVTSKSLSDEEKISPYYLDVLAQLEVEHILYAIVRSSSAIPIGQLSVYRSAEDPAFDETDANSLRDCLHYLAKALASKKFVPNEPDSAAVAEEGVGVFDEAGKQLFADGTWLRLVRLARGEPISPASARLESDAIDEFIRGILLTASSSKNAMQIIDSPWGQFAFRHALLSSEDGQKARALSVSRLSKDSVKLVEGAAKLALSAQQREVALLVAGGNTNQEIAEKLGVTLNTASYHVKQLFTKLDVRNRGDVARLLRQA